jgi:ABC-2 type transport system ATP-binding protein
MTAAIAAEGLGKRYGSTWALQNLTATVPAGTVCALVGANGAGKSTLLRMLAGVADPTTGSVTVAGRRPADEVEFLSRIGYVAQDIPLYRRWSVADHLQLGARLNHDWDEASARDRLNSLAIPLDRKVSALSGGMRAQVALALALSKRPEVLLLDEPLAALDPLARRDFMSMVVAAVAEQPLTVLLSSHLLPDLERICDHLLVLAGGRLVLSDTIESVVSSHKVMTSTARDTTNLEREHDVIAVNRTPRQVSAVVRVNGPVVEPGWEIEDVSLEEIVLAYLGQGRETVTLPSASSLALVQEGR